MHKIVTFLICAMICMQIRSAAWSHAPVTRNRGDIAVHPIATTETFLKTIGVGTSFPDRGQPLSKTIDMVRYCGFRWIRSGIEGLTDNGPTTMATYLELHRATGVKFSWGLLSGGTDLEKLTRTARILAENDALLAIEGNNEPNNWGVEYLGEKGGGDNESWMAVAHLQRDLYSAVKRDPVLRNYPVWSITEPGAQRDNVGLQFLEIPRGAGTLMPDGTRYADFANVHNYFFHPHSPKPEDNKTWNAADPGVNSRVDGLYGNFSVTWSKGFKGHSAHEIDDLPRVTTETGTNIEGDITEEIQAKYILNMYLDQFAHGYDKTAVYILRDRTDEDGNQTFGFFDPGYRPRLSAHYLHNLTSILGAKPGNSTLQTIAYAIDRQTDSVHELSLANGDGSIFMVVWGEKLTGTAQISVLFGNMFNRISVFDPTVGTVPTRTLRLSKEIDLQISDHPIILLLQ